MAERRSLEAKVLIKIVSDKLTIDDVEDSLGEFINNWHQKAKIENVTIQYYGFQKI
jgi:hypothetical protein